MSLFENGSTHAGSHWDVPASGQRRAGIQRPLAGGDAAPGDQLLWSDQLLGVNPCWRGKVCVPPPFLFFFSSSNQEECLIKY